MTAARRDDKDIAWLEARARGEPLPPLDAKRATEYDALEAMIATLPDEELDPAWEAEVIAAIAAPGVMAGVGLAGPSSGAVESAGQPASVARSPGASAQGSLNRASALGSSPGVGAAGGQVTRAAMAARAQATASEPAIAPLSAARAPRWRWIAAGATVAAVALGVMLWPHRVVGPTPMRLPPSPAAYAPPMALRDPEPRLSAHVVRAGDQRGGDGAAIGDVLQIEVAGADAGELRVYRDDREVVLRCPGDDTCSTAAEMWSAKLRLSAPGSYRVVLLRPASFAPSTGTLDGDLAACGCASRMAAPIVVR